MGDECRYKSKKNECAGNKVEEKPQKRKLDSDSKKTQNTEWIDKVGCNWGQEKRVE